MGFEVLDILVVDDHAFTRAIVIDVLRAHNVRNIRQAGDAVHALELFRIKPPDIAIVDFDMPHSGLDFLRAVRTEFAPPLSATPIILMTGHSGLARIEALRDAGANEILAKPLTAQKLMSRVISIIDQPRPFVVQETYKGPDRRRRVTESELRRRADDRLRTSLGDRDG